MRTSRSACCAASVFCGGGMAGADAEVRIGVDIGGTFTDIVLERGPERFTAKVLTTPDAPEDGVRQGLAQAMEACGTAPAEVALVIHGTTLATNAMIERKGARTALVTTEGFRDSIEMGTESRFEQYDIDMEKPVPLVPRRWRFPIPERLDAAGEPILPLDEAAVAATARQLAAEGIESVAIGLLHSYVNPAHERRVRAILQEAMPDLAITLSAEVAPEMREYERFSTACANAYVQPVMARYLRNLEDGLRDAGFRCPLFVMLSGGGVADIGTAIRFPIRLVESGPVGGAVFASHVARQCGLDRVLSFDMGGTTAKICLIDDAQPQTTRAFEVARAHRFLKGSGLPLRIPVIEMVEIGAGGGSIAVVDRLGRIAVGPESAGAQPGPACYGQGGRGAHGDRRRPRSWAASTRPRSPAGASRSTKRPLRTRWQARSARRSISTGRWRLSGSARWWARTWRAPPASMPSRSAPRSASAR